MPSALSRSKDSSTSCLPFCKGTLRVRNIPRPSRTAPIRCGIPANHANRPVESERFKIKVWSYRRRRIQRAVDTMFANEFGTTSLMRFGRSHTTSSFLYGQSARIWPAPCSTRTSMIASGYFLLRFLRKGIARTVSPIYRLRITSIRFFRFCCLDFIRITFCLPP